jgi:F420-dependent oxidoreductase-like protein
MQVSLSITDYSFQGGDGGSTLAAHLARIAHAADAAGVDTVWVSDHLIQATPGSSPDAEMLEAYTTLAFLSAQTKRVRIGAMVSNASLRPAALLIKSVTTLDVLSEGRTWLGIGAGYHEDEAAAMGFDLPPMEERFERLEETLRLARHMWSGDTSPFQAKHLRLRRPVGNPQPLTKPHPPILIGGMGEKTTLRLVARYANACNLGDIPDGGRTVTHKLDVLARHCEAIGRPYDEIEKTLSTRLETGESAEHFTERCAALATLGIEHVVVITAGPWRDDAVATLAAAVPAVRQLDRNSGDSEATPKAH